MEPFCNNNNIIYQQKKQQSEKLNENDFKSKLFALERGEYVWVVGGYYYYYYLMAMMGVTIIEITMIAVAIILL